MSSNKAFIPNALVFVNQSSFVCNINSLKNYIYQLQKPLNIAVNTRFLIHNKLEGIGRFTFETLKRISRAHPQHRFYCIFDRPPHKEFLFSNNIIPIIAKPPARHPILWYCWFEWSVPRILKKIKA